MEKAPQYIHDVARLVLANYGRMGFDDLRTYRRDSLANGDGDGLKFWTAVEREAERFLNERIGPHWRDVLD